MILEAIQERAIQASQGRGFDVEFQRNGLTMKLITGMYSSSYDTYCVGKMNLGVLEVSFRQTSNFTSNKQPSEVVIPYFIEYARYNGARGILFHSAYYNPSDKVEFHAQYGLTPLYTRYRFSFYEGWSGGVYYREFENGFFDRLYGTVKTIAHYCKWKHIYSSDSSEYEEDLLRQGEIGREFYFKDQNDEYQMVTIGYLKEEDLFTITFQDRMYRIEQPLEISAILANIFEDHEISFCSNSGFKRVDLREFGTMPILENIISTPYEFNPYKSAFHKAVLAGARKVVDATSLQIEGVDSSIPLEELIRNIDRYIGKKAVWTVILGENTGRHIRLYQGTVKGQIKEPTATYPPGYKFEAHFFPDSLDNSMRNLSCNGGKINVSPRAMAFKNWQSQHYIQEIDAYLMENYLHMMQTNED